MKFSRWQRYLLSIMSGLLMVLAFPHTGSLFPLVFIAWVPLLLIEHHIYREKYRSSKLLLHAYITFLIYNIGTTYWIYYSIGGEAAAILAYFLNGIIMALAFMLFHWTKKFIGQKEGYIGLFFFWIGFEHIHFVWELSWPWLTIGNTFSTVPEIVQWYSYTGALGGSLWILIVNVLIFKICSNILFGKESFKVQTPLVILVSLILIVPIGSSLVSYWSYTEGSNPLEIVVTQPNTDPYNEKFTSDPDGIRANLDEFILPAKELVTKNTAFVLAPETAIAMGFNEDTYEKSISLNYLQEVVNDWGNTALLTGASTYRIFEEHTRPSMRKIGDSGLSIEFYNTSVLLTKNKPPIFVHKSELVLGVEKIPFTRWLPFLEELSVQNGGTSGTLGVEDEPQVMEAEGVSVAPIICYESVYGDFISKQGRKGAEAIFVITNDGWWGNSAGHKQHATFARLRAVETRKYVARSANTGISCVINQRGDVVTATDYWVKDAFRATIQLNSTPTFYVKYGDIIGRTFTFVFFLLGGYTLVKYFQKFKKSI